MKEISVQELKKMMDENIDFQLIDVRELHEFEIANLGGELIPLGEIIDQCEKISRDKPVIIHCRSGARSAAALRELVNRFGFTNLANLKGGIIAWSKEIDTTMHVS